jgi:hypothetical protein
MPVSEPPDVHAASLAESAALSANQVPGMIAPLDIVAALNQAEVNFVLVGAHGLSGWVADPRATRDVDVVVMSRHLKRATRALLEAFPHLQSVEYPAVIRFRDRTSGKIVIDALKQRELYREAFKHTRTVSASGQTYKIPSLEMALAMKFAAMLSPNRDDADRFQDAHDFINIVRANPEFDRKKAAALGEQVCAGGGSDLLEMVRKVQAGEKLSL